MTGKVHNFSFSRAKKTPSVLSTEGVLQDLSFGTQGITSPHFLEKARPENLNFYMFRLLLIFNMMIQKVKKVFKKNKI